MKVPVLCKSVYGNVIGANLLERGLPHIEHFSSEREDAIAVSANHTQPRHSKSLGRVSLSKNQRAANRVLPTCKRTQSAVMRPCDQFCHGVRQWKNYFTCIVCIVQFRHTFDFCVFDGRAFLVEL